MPKSASDLVTEAKSQVENLSVEQTEAGLERGNAVLIDLRETDEREQSGAIPGAVHAPRGMLEFYADPTTVYHKAEFDRDRRVILHCASGGRSALAAVTLQELGYDNVAHLDGGIKAWKDAGEPVEEVRAT